MVFTLGTLKNFANFAGKIHVLESLFKKALGPQACKFIKKRLQHRYFPVKLAKLSRTLFLQNTSEQNTALPSSEIHVQSTIWKA